MMLKEFLEWLDENEYLKDDNWNYEIIEEQYLHQNVMDWIKNIFNNYYLISSSVVWFDEWENTYKCTFSVNWFKDVDTERLNEKLKNKNLYVMNVRINKKQQNPYSLVTAVTTTYYSNRDKYDYIFEIGVLEDDEES